MDILVYLIKCCNIKLPQNDTAIMLQRINALEEKLMNIHDCCSGHIKDADKTELNENTVNHPDDSFCSYIEGNPFTEDTEIPAEEQKDFVSAQEVKEQTDDGMNNYILSLLAWRSSLTRHIFLSYGMTIVLYFLDQVTTNGYMRI